MAHALYHFKCVRWLLGMLFACRCTGAGMRCCCHIAVSTAAQLGPDVPATNVGFVSHGDQLPKRLADLQHKQDCSHKREHPAQKFDIQVSFRRNQRLKKHEQQPHCMAPGSAATAAIAFQPKIRSLPEPSPTIMMCPRPSGLSIMDRDRGSGVCKERAGGWHRVIR